LITLYLGSPNRKQYKHKIEQNNKQTWKCQANVAKKWQAKKNKNIKLGNKKKRSTLLLQQKELNNKEKPKLKK